MYEWLQLTSLSICTSSFLASYQTKCSLATSPKGSGSASCLTPLMLTLSSLTSTPQLRVAVGCVVEAASEGARPQIVSEVRVPGRDVAAGHVNRPCGASSERPAASLVRAPGRKPAQSYTMSLMLAQVYFVLQKVQRTLKYLLTTYASIGRSPANCNLANRASSFQIAAGVAAAALTRIGGGDAAWQLRVLVRVPQGKN